MKNIVPNKASKNKNPSKYDAVFKVDATFEEVMQTALHTNKRELKSYKEIQKLKKADS
jgi:hypothetical protein